MQINIWRTCNVGRFRDITGLVSKVVPSANTGALTPGGFKAAGGRAQARQAASPALPRTSSQG